MVTDAWHELNNKYPGIILDQFIVMPNHIHGIIGIVEADLCACPEIQGSTHRSTPTLGEMIRWFKTMTTNYYIRGIKIFGWKRLNKKFWQRNYYEHIIRDEIDLERIRQYIKHNTEKPETSKGID
jgi:putative transposase